MSAARSSKVRRLGLQTKLASPLYARVDTYNVGKQRSKLLDTAPRQARIRGARTDSKEHSPQTPPLDTPSRDTKQPPELPRSPDHPRACRERETHLAYSKVRYERPHALDAVAHKAREILQLVVLPPDRSHRNGAVGEGLFAAVEGDVRGDR